MQQRALGASVAALGLSNKAVYEDDVLNGPSAEPSNGVTQYTEVRLPCPLCKVRADSALNTFRLDLVTYVVPFEDRCAD